MTSAGRALPLRIKPLDGESLDSWLEALARRNDLSLRGLMAILGLPSNIYHIRPLITDLPFRTLRDIERRTGLEPGRLDEAVAGPGFPLGPRHTERCRFYPRCLAENGGRWLLRWRIPWVFACTNHRMLLQDTCPTCQMSPRRGIPVHRRGFPAGTCTAKIPRAATCESDLSAVRATTLPAGHQLIDAQRGINDLINGDREQAVSVFADLLGCSRWLMHCLTRADLRMMGSTIRETWSDQPPPAGRTTRATPIPAAVAGVIVHYGQSLLAGEEGTAIQMIRELRHRHESSMSIRPRGMSIAQWEQLSEDLRGRFLQAADPSMSAMDRVRLRTRTPEPRLPRPGDPRLAARVRHLPQLLWPGWTLRLMPRRGIQEDLFRGVASALLLLPGEPVRSARKVTDRLSPHLPNYFAVTLQILVRSGHEDVLAAICRLASHLDEHGSPIDYQRRRALIPQSPISPEDWRQLCFATDTQPGDQGRRTSAVPRSMHAQRYLWQLLTGSDLEDPSHRLTWRSRADRTRYVSFALSLPLAQRAALNAHGFRLLQELGIDEPVSWEPPDECGDGLNLPGPRLTDSVQEAVRRIVIEERRAPREAARELGTTLAHIRFALERLDRTLPPQASNTVLSAWQARQRARNVVTAEFLQGEYIEAGKNMRRLAEETAIPRSIIIERARSLGLTVYRTARPATIDEEWLRDQYVAQQRSSQNIADELGLEDMTVLRRLHRLGIPVRSKGVHSQPALIRRLDRSIPRDVRKAVEGTLGGWLRLRRFQIAMKFPSLTTAADYLGVHGSALVTQCQRLECDLGGKLFNRSAFGRPQRPTARGQALLRDLTLDRVQVLMNAALRDDQVPPMPGAAALASAAMRSTTRSAPGPLTPFDGISVERIRISSSTRVLLRVLLDHPSEEFYGVQIRAQSRLGEGTLYPILNRLERAGWLTSRPEDDQSWLGRATVGRGPGRRRIYYTLTTEGRRAAAYEVEHRRVARPRKAT
ncbi:TniQ family protein [Streptacidiphilus sp. N1-10]|uniref:TniQ family protein n=1 Tax=Streptacidiphilus jeojiensis TaxID=3229225 RepID=A0ABV6XXI9_9ACTN